MSDAAPKLFLRAQALVALMLCACLCAAFATAVYLAHNTDVIAKRNESELARQREINGVYFNAGGFKDEGDEVLIRQWPQADYSRGGVYFIGASEMKLSLLPAMLPPGERALIHNYALGDLRHREVYYIARMLIEERGLLAAGPENTTVVLALSYQSARVKNFALVGDRYVKMLFERHHLYSYNWNDGIHRAWQPPFMEQLRIERVYANRFMRSLGWERSLVRPGTMPVQVNLDHLRSFMHADWRQVMRAEVDTLAEQIDYLQGLGVKVRAVYPPNGSWQYQLPYDAAYRAMVDPILESRHVQVYDFAHVLRDDEFGDAVHANYGGGLKLHEAYRRVALDALAEMGTQVRP
ncbi:MAG: hypothetical protein ABW199_11055 [Caulobacterales bacterium]